MSGRRCTKSETPVAAPPHPVKQHRQLRLQPYGNAPRLDVGTRTGIHIGPAASGQDLRAALQQAGDHPGFALAKIVLAVLGEDLAHRLAGGNLDLAVGVGEPEVEFGRKPPSDGRFAGSHEADQHDAPRCKRLADAGLSLRRQFFLALSQS